MKIPIYFSEKNYKRRVNKDSKFILIGNNIDGYVDFNFCEFKNFETVVVELPEILYNLEAFGEWDLNLYQVKDSYQIRKKYGYYKHPKKGKLIYSHSYMDLPIREIKFENSSILFIGCQLDVEENWNSEDVFYEKDLMIEVKRLKFA